MKQVHFGITYQRKRHTDWVSTAELIITDSSAGSDWKCTSILPFKLRLLNSVKSISVMPGLGTSHFSKSMESLVPIKSEPSARLLICFNCGKVLQILSVVYLWEFIFPLKAEVCYFWFWFLRVPERPLNATAITYWAYIITPLEKSLLGEGLFGDTSSLFILEPPTVEGSRVQFLICLRVPDT